MKKVLLTLVLSLAVMLSTQAQSKFGYLNSNELLAMMPESQSMQEELQTYAKGLESQLTAMQAEYEKKVVEYQQNETSYTEIIKEDKIRDWRNTTTCCWVPEKRSTIFRWKRSWTVCSNKRESCSHRQSC